MACPTGPRILIPTTQCVISQFLILALISVEIGGLDGRSPRVAGQGEQGGILRALWETQVKKACLKKCTNQREQKIPSHINRFLVLK